MEIVQQIKNVWKISKKIFLTNWFFLTFFSKANFCGSFPTIQKSVDFFTQSKFVRKYAKKTKFFVKKKKFQEGKFLWKFGKKKTNSVEIVQQSELLWKLSKKVVFAEIFQQSNFCWKFSNLRMFWWNFANKTVWNLEGIF